MARIGGPHMTIRSTEKMRVALETIADLKGRVERLEARNALPTTVFDPIEDIPSMTFPLSALDDSDPSLVRRGPGRPRKVIE